MRSAEDAFGASVGRETIGLYSPDDVRGFSALTAGNVRIDGLYFDQQTPLSAHLIGGFTMRVGLSAQGFAFPAPTGIVDYQLRRPDGVRSLSVMAGGTTWGGYSLDVDAETPITSKLSLGAGGGVYHDVFANRTFGDYLQYAVIARWRPWQGVEITPFFEADPILDNPASAVYFTRDGAPPASLPSTYQGPDWATYRGHNTNTGMVLTASLWRNASLRAGVFHSSSTTRTLFSEIFQDLTTQGVADRMFIADPPLAFTSDSGEIRLAQGFVEGARHHLILASLRARGVESHYGGSDSVDVGYGPIDPAPAVAEPAFVLGPTTHNSVHQWFAGLSYVLDWRGIGDATVGFQKTNYVRTVTAPGVSPAVSTEAPILWNASLILNLRPGLVAYASHATGLEEAGQAPDAAINRLAVAKAIETRQTDAGLRWKPVPALSLVAGVFDVEKPYYGIDDTGYFRRIGTIENHGVEASFTGAPAPGWTVVLGGALLDSDVTVRTDRPEGVGSEPVGSTPAKVDANVEYAPPSAPAWSFDAGFNWRHHVIASLDGAQRLPPRATFDLGLRYRLKKYGASSLIRVQVTNILGTTGDVVVGPGAYQRADDRKGLITLTTYF